MPDTPPELTALAQPDPPVNILHAELFHHLSTQTSPSISETGSGLSLPLGEVIDYGLAAPYLLNERKGQRMEAAEPPHHLGRATRKACSLYLLLRTLY